MSQLVMGMVIGFILGGWAGMFAMALFVAAGRRKEK